MTMLTMAILSVQILHSTKRQEQGHRHYLVGCRSLLPTHGKLKVYNSAVSVVDSALIAATTFYMIFEYNMQIRAEIVLPCISLRAVMHLDSFVDFGMNHLLAYLTSLLRFFTYLFLHIYTSLRIGLFCFQAGGHNGDRTYLYFLCKFCVVVYFVRDVCLLLLC